MFFPNSVFEPVKQNPPVTKSEEKRPPHAYRGLRGDDPPCQDVIRMCVHMEPNDANLKINKNILEMAKSCNTQNLKPNRNHVGVLPKEGILHYHPRWGSWSDLKNYLDSLIQKAM